MNCRICGNASGDRHYNIKEMFLGLKETFRYFQCSNCDCLQIAEIPADMSKYYPRDYYSYETISGQHGAKGFLIRKRNKYALWGRGLIGKFLYMLLPSEKLATLKNIPMHEGSKILEVGCGAGHLLYALRELGMRNLYGIDPFNESDIEYDNGLKIDKKEIRDVTGKWDVIMFHHSLEHIPDQIQTLETVSVLLKSGGYCLISIPVVSSYAWNHYGVNWVQLDAPRHFFLHSLKSMGILADQAGLELHRIIHNSTAVQFMGSEKYLRDVSFAEKYEFSDREMSKFAKRAKALNESGQGDQAVFYLRKPLAPGE